MIAAKAIEQAKNAIKWQYDSMVEQDMIISRALASLYDQDIIRETLVFKGGTAINKLCLDPPSRYSEDIDLVRIAGDKIGPISKAISKAMLWLVDEAGLGKPQYTLRKYGLKYFYKFQNVTGAISKLKIEVNTRERFFVTPPKEVPFSFVSDWWRGQTTITTFCLEELMATKIRALYQRRKGRDLFDVWYAFSKGFANLDKTLAMFHAYNKYNEANITQKLFANNMLEKKHHTDFRQDIRALLPLHSDYDFDAAFDFVMRKVVALI